MNPKVETAVRSVLKLDPDFDPVKADAAMDVLKGRTVASLRKKAELDPVMSRKEVADHLEVDVHTVDKYGREGVITKIPGSGSRALGYSTESVRDYKRRRDMMRMGVRP